MTEGLRTITSWNGRLKRLPYVVVLVAVFIAVAILKMIIGGTLGSVLAFAGQILLIPSQIKRLHDIGWTPWLCVLSFIPVLGFILAVLLIFFPGKK